MDVGSVLTLFGVQTVVIPRRKILARWRVTQEVIDAFNGGQCMDDTAKVPFLGHYEGMRAPAAGSGSAPTLRQRLNGRLESLRQQQADVEIAIAALDATPGSELLLDALSKIGM